MKLYHQHLTNPIETDEDYQNALAAVWQLMDAEPGSEDADHLEAPSILVEAYEKVYTPVDAPDPISYIEFVMEAKGLSRKDLTAYFGSRPRVTEIMNRQHKLTLGMIRRLHEGLGIPTDTLVQPYDAPATPGVPIPKRTSKQALHVSAK